eukprot:TRINITY_DN15057_c0_g1_i5.p1 TRINITY_DN15057_c0_g1~~TRINITY_DN15057_c0_g1_i5.p1  ORF type:complete len:1348 (+),score=503.40 TRINITY_DN15057_c0_g1_i5:31-4044(+)
MSEADARSLKTCRGPSSESVRSGSFETCSSGVEILARKVSDYRSAHTLLVKDHHIMKTENDKLWSKVHSLEDESKKLGLIHLSVREECAVMTRTCAALHSAETRPDSREGLACLHDHMKKIAAMLAIPSSPLPCHSTNRDIEAKLIASRSHIEDLELANEQLQATVKNLSLELTEMDTLRTANMKLTRDYSALLKARATSETRDRDTCTPSRESEHEQRLSELKKQVHALSTGNATLMQQLTELEASKGTIISDLQRQITSLSSVMADMSHSTSETEKLREENDALRKQLSQRASPQLSGDTAVMYMQTEIAKLKAECSKYESMNEKLNLDVRRMEADKARYGALLEPLEQELIRQQKAVGDMAGEKVKLQEEATRLRAANADLHRRIKEGEQELVMMTSRCHTLQAETDALQRETSCEARELHQQLDSLRTELEGVRSNFENEKRNSHIVEGLLQQATKNDTDVAVKLAAEVKLRQNLEDELRTAQATIRQLETRTQEPADPEILRTLAELKAHHALRTTEFDAMKEDLLRQKQMEEELRELKALTSQSTSSLNLELEVTRAKLEDAKETISKLEGSLGHMKEQNLHDITASKMENSKLLTELSLVRSEVCKLEEERLKMRKRDSDMEAELEAVKQERSKYRQTVECLEEEMSSMRRKHTEAVQRETGTLSTELESTCRKLAEAKTIIAQLEASLEQASKACQAEKEQGLISKLENHSLREEVEALKKSCMAMKTTVDRQKEQLAEQDMSASANSALLQKTAKQRDELTAEVEKLREQYARSNMLVEEMKHTERRLRSEGEQSDTSLDTYKREISRLHVLLEDKDRVLQSQQAQYEGLEAAAAQLQHEVTLLRRTDEANEELQQQLKDTTDKNASLDKTCESLQSELQCTQHVLETTQCDLRVTRAKVAEKESNIRKLEEQNEQLVSEVARLTPVPAESTTSVERMIEALRKELHEGKKEETAFAKQEAARLAQELNNDRSAQITKIGSVLQSLSPGRPLPRSPNSGFKELDTKATRLKDDLRKAEMEIAGLKQIVAIHQETEERLREEASDWSDVMPTDSESLTQDFVQLKGKAEKESSVLRKVTDTILTIAFTVEGSKGHELREAALALPKCVQAFDYLVGQIKIGLKKLSGLGQVCKQTSESREALLSSVKVARQQAFNAQQELDACLTEWEVERTLYVEEVRDLKELHCERLHDACILTEERLRAHVMLQEAEDFGVLTEASKNDLLETCMVMQSEVNCATRQWNAIKDELWAFVTSNVVKEEQSHRSALQQMHEHGLLELTIWLLSVSQASKAAPDTTAAYTVPQIPRRSPTASWTNIRPTASLSNPEQVS